MHAHDVSRELDILIRRGQFRRADLHRFGIGTLPPLEVVTPVGIVGIDGESERTSLEVGIRRLDLETLCKNYI
jgi:hypothetical protein